MTAAAALQGPRAPPAPVKPTSKAKRQKEGKKFDALTPCVRAADYLLSYRAIRVLFLAALQPLVVARYVYERAAPKRFVAEVVRRRRKSVSPTSSAPTAATPQLMMGSASLSPTRSMPSLGLSSGGRQSVTVRPKFHRNATSASDLCSETSGSLYSTASNSPTYIPKLNKYAILRTPDAQFEPIKKYFPYAPVYFKLGAMRVHYVDRGARSAPGQKTVILVHGALTWSYLYRKVIDPLVAAGLRVVAVDLPGHGKSDKLPTSGSSLLQLQVAAVRHLLVHFGANQPGMDVTLVAHGTGGLVAAVALAEMGDGDLVKRVVFLNSFLPPHQEESTAREIETLLLSTSLYYIFRTHTRPSTHMRCITALAPHTTLTAAESVGYDVPYPTALHAHATQKIPLSTPLPLFSDPLVLRLRELAPRVTAGTPVLGTLLSNNMHVEMETEKAKLFWAGYVDRVLRRRRWIDTNTAPTGTTTTSANAAVAPALVIVGELDRVWNAPGRWMADLIGADVVRFPNAGHYAPEDDPEALVRCLLGYIGA
ncbi:hypothetical protein PhCBS80983_g04913 [Powellomyces hirtus]|uniref:AB hydrolase-1 domain-containing protein n=1 Tax=Powellomyces hirtus TaxID=109895 RepID=A0A507DYN1_9FUNG|nr:hypothetical protein PhCBS80983_g04913 [Powellomyces hirtus]